MAEGVRNLVLNELPFRGISVNTLAGADASIAVVASESGVLFVNHCASATTYTLPTVALAKGKWFWFFNVGAAGMIITGGTASVMVRKNSATSTSVTFATSSEMIGAACLIMCDGTNYFCFNLSTCTIT